VSVQVQARFHLAFPVLALEPTRAFYGDVLGCPVGRRAERWIDFDFFGHQISAHVAPDELADVASNEVDGKAVPVRHFGAILAWDDWETLGQRLHAHGATFVIEPYVRFQGQVGEQGTMFVRDPSGNCLEFKSFRDMSQVFAT
jgi:uncharacterized protein